ncbi:unnamed protein product [Polarella glacialis]|uniref:Uncharacterized protein n=1 Tax=Polarella glacialis TaxID=89957 RepID=A0A813DEW2_POLGL|nr:unnamed protein product [Polarella glacialis]
MSMRGMNCRFVRNQAFAKRGMKCTDEEKVERLAAQKEAQKRMVCCSWCYLSLVSCWLCW